MAEEWASGINQKALLTWVRKAGINLVQVNGQRRYGGPPPGWVGSPPPPGSEVYIAKLPRDLYEDTLIPLFQSVGQLYEFRLMLTFSGLNRGFAFAKYRDQHIARKAIAALNNWEVQEGCTILVCRSLEKCELSVTGLPAKLCHRELNAMLLEATEGLTGLMLHTRPGRKQGKVAVLTYSSHRAAAMAKKALVEGNIVLFKKNVKVEWLKPELKRLLQACGEKPPPGSVQCLRSPEMGLPSSELHGVFGRLGALCQQLHLGIPRFLTSTFLWVWEDTPGTVGHEKIKEALAHLALMMLGHQACVRVHVP